MPAIYKVKPISLIWLECKHYLHFPTSSVFSVSAQAVGISVRRRWRSTRTRP